MNALRFKIQRADHKITSQILKKIVIFCIFFLPGFSSLSFAVDLDEMIVVSSDSYAAKTAIQILKEGGNASDALVAASFVLNVSEPQYSGIGGGAFLIYYDAGEQRIYAFDGTGAVIKDIYKKENNFTTVPGALKLLKESHARFRSGKFAFETLLNPAIKYGEEGVLVSHGLADSILKERKRLSLIEPQDNFFIAQNGEFLKEGDRIIQSDLSKTLRLIQKKGTDYFYNKNIASAIVKTIKKIPKTSAVMNKKDISAYKIRKRDLIYGSYRDYDIFTMTRPVLLGDALMEAMNIVENFKLDSFLDAPETFHVVAEAQKIVFHDIGRSRNLETFDNFLNEFISKEYAKEKSDLIQFENKIKTPKERSEFPPESKKGSYLLMADSRGNYALYIATLGDVFGSATVVSDYGFLLNENISLESSILPVLVFKDRKPFFVVLSYSDMEGVASAMSVLINKIDFNKTCEDSLKAPRILGHYGKPLEMEKALYDNALIKLQLELWGHNIKEKSRIGNAQVICFDYYPNGISGESDSRGRGVVGKN